MGKRKGSLQTPDPLQGEKNPLLQPFLNTPKAVKGAPFVRGQGVEGAALLIILQLVVGFSFPKPFYR
jgi:hypothetical protein